PVSSFEHLLSRCRKVEYFRDHGFHALTKLSKTGQSDLASRQPRFFRAMETLEELRQAVNESRLEGQLAAQTLRRLQEQVRAFKQQRGWHSFEDMLVRMDEGLDPAKNPAARHLLERLREKYRYAIVDEFQDTDPLQWRIFRRIFLE